MALASRFPAAEVVPEVLYVDDAPILSRAGTAAGIDASLYLWRQEFGSAAASDVARRMVVPPQRDGGRAQFIRHPVPQDHSESFGPLLGAATLRHHLGRSRGLSPQQYRPRFAAAR